jgi:hypothetical protein
MGWQGLFVVSTIGILVGILGTGVNSKPLPDGNLDWFVQSVFSSVQIDYIHDAATSYQTYIECSNLKTLVRPSEEPASILELSWKLNDLFSHDAKEAYGEFWQVVHLLSTQDRQCMAPKCVRSPRDILVCGGFGIPVSAWSHITDFRFVPPSDDILTSVGPDCLDPNVIYLLGTTFPVGSSEETFERFKTFVHKPIFCWLFIFSS